MSLEISAILPTIGRIDYLDLSIESLLNQLEPFNEIIVFDNSKEQNLKSVSRFGDDKSIKWIRSINFISDPIKSWNTAASYCTKEYFSFIGDDDILLDNYVCDAKKMLENADLLFMKSAIIGECGKILSYPKYLNNRVLTSREFINARFNKKTSLYLPGSVIKKDHFDKIGGFLSSGLPGSYFPDDLLYFQLSKISKNVAFSNEISWFYRIHSEQIGKIDSLKVFSESVNKYIDILESRLNKIEPSNQKLFDKYYSRKDYYSEIHRFGVIKYLSSSDSIMKKILEINKYFVFNGEISFKLKCKMIFRVIKSKTQVKNAV